MLTVTSLSMRDQGATHCGLRDLSQPPMVVETSEPLGLPSRRALL
jgi:hypothetical protein